MRSLAGRAGMLDLRQLVSQLLRMARTKAAIEDRKNMRPTLIYLTMSKLNMVLYDIYCSFLKGRGE
jgi:hypothetical protein